VKVLPIEGTSGSSRDGAPFTRSRVQLILEDTVPSHFGKCLTSISLNSVSLHVVYVAYTSVCFTRVSVPIGNGRPYMCMIRSEVVANASLIPRLSLLQPGNEARLMPLCMNYVQYSKAEERSYITVLGFRPIVCRLEAVELNIKQGNQSTLLPLS